MTKVKVIKDLPENFEVSLERFINAVLGFIDDQVSLNKQQKVVIDNLEKRLHELEQSSGDYVNKKKLN